MNLMNVRASSKSHKASRSHFIHHAIPTSRFVHASMMKINPKSIPRPIIINGIAVTTSVCRIMEFNFAADESSIKTLCNKKGSKGKV